MGQTLFRRTVLLKSKIYGVELEDPLFPQKRKFRLSPF